MQFESYLPLILTFCKQVIIDVLMHICQENSMEKALEIRLVVGDSHFTHKLPVEKVARAEGQSPNRLWKR